MSRSKTYQKAHKQGQQGLLKSRFLDNLDLGG